MQKAKQETKLKSRRNIQIPFLSSILTNKKKKTRVMSGIGAAVIGFSLYQLSTITGNSDLMTFGFIGAVITAVVPSAMLNVKEVRRRDSIDRNLPIFLLSLISAVQSGSSLMRAIEEAANRNMGSLTDELKNLRANISWGMPIQEAFDNFNKRVNTRMAQRVTVLLQLAIDIGGDVVNTLEIIQKHTSEMQEIEKERKSALQPYIFTIYISFIVFLGITIILVSQFFTEITNVQVSLEETSRKSGVPLGMFGALLGVDVKELSKIMLNMSIIEAIFGGAAAGKIGEASFVAGIKHMIVMIVMAVAGFQIVGI